MTKRTKYAPGFTCAMLPRIQVYDVRVILPTPLNCNDAWDVLEAALKPAGLEMTAAIAIPEYDVDAYRDNTNVGLSADPFAGFASAHDEDRGQA